MDEQLVIERNALAQLRQQLTREREELAAGPAGVEPTREKLLLLRLRLPLRRWNLRPQPNPPVVTASDRLANLRRLKESLVERRNALRRGRREQTDIRVGSDRHENHIGQGRKFGLPR